MAVVINGTSGITTNSGTLLSNSTIGVGGTTPSASGAGITFPATQSASTDANTLDDYEEGTWTPAWSFSTSGSVTLSIANGRYTKIGNKVFVEIHVQTSAISSPSGGATITGLPFTPTLPQGTLAIGYQRRWATDMPNLVFLIESTGISGFVNATNATGATNLAGSNFSSGDGYNTLYLSGFYTV